MRSFEMLKDSIIDRCFCSSQIKDRLKDREIKPEVLSSLILTSPLPLDEKQSIFLELAEKCDSPCASIFLLCSTKLDDVLSWLALHTEDALAPNSAKLMSAECLLSLIDDALEYAKGEEDDEEECEDEQWITFASVNGELKVAENDQEALFDVLADALATAEVSETDGHPVVVSFDGDPVFALSKELSALAFRKNDSTLFELQSLFVGLLQPGAILELDFRPFYVKRYGIILEASRAMKDSMSEEDYVRSERVLVNTPDGWVCGELAWRDDLFKCLDPIGPYFNSYSRVKELDAEEAASLASNRATGDLGLILEIQKHIEREPKLARAIVGLMRSRDRDGLKGMSDDELRRFCKSALESLHQG